MKRWMTFLLALLMLAGSAAAEGENVLLRHAVELGQNLDALAADEAYLAEYSLDAEVLSLISALGEGDRSVPCEVVAVDFDAVLGQLTPELSALPETARCSTQKRLPAMLVSSVVNSYGYMAATANAVVRAGQTFAAKDVTGQGLWILRYENALPVAIAWYAENGAVSMQASIFPADELAFDAADFPTRVIAAPRPELDEAAAQLAAELQELARSDEYLRFMGLSEEVLAMAHSFAAAEGEEAFLTLCALTDDPAQVSSCLTQELGMLGVVPLAAVSSLHHTMIFAEENASGSGLYVFLYEGSTPIVVQWQGGEGAYALSASFQPGESLAGCQSGEDVSAWTQGLGRSLNFQAPGVMLLP